jgi:hypothetical protein
MATCSRPYEAERDTRSGFGVRRSEFGVRRALRAVLDALIITVVSCEDFPRVAFASLRGFSESSFAFLINRARARRRARARKAIKPHFSLGWWDGLRKDRRPDEAQVERRGRTKSGPIVPYAL